MSARLAVALAAVAALALCACGSESRPDGTEISVARQAPPPVLPPTLEAGVEAETAEFLEREGTALRGSLRRFLGPRMTTEVEPDSAICRPSAETASIAEPDRYPFACAVRASADAEGLEVEITLGFVGLELDDDCWRAANERVSATTTAPALLSKEEALRPVNQIAGCVPT